MTFLNYSSSTSGTVQVRQQVYQAGRGSLGGGVPPYFHAINDLWIRKGGMLRRAKVRYVSITKREVSRKIGWQSIRAARIFVVPAGGRY